MTDNTKCYKKALTNQSTEPNANSSKCTLNVRLMTEPVWDVDETYSIVSELLLQMPSHHSISISPWCV